MCARFSFNMCLKIMLMEKCFVMRSALLPSPGILVRGTIFFAHCSWNRREITYIPKNTKGNLSKTNISELKLENTSL